MKQVLIQGGGVSVAEVPAPTVGAKNVLVRVAHSCISVGTEGAGVKASGEPLYRRALKQPENVALAFRMMKEEGIKRTVNVIRGYMETGQPTGYSAAGTVIEVGPEVDGFTPGDRVACAGAGVANHAEIINVPVNLTARIPDGLSTELAATGTLGAIAMQGLRRASPTLGESVLVVGMGILGQLTAQFFQRNGCTVIGVDFDRKRLNLALENGMHHAIAADQEDMPAQVMRLTGDFGADIAVITAGAPENHQIIKTAMNACRKKGRVVLVGDVGLNIKREDLFKKELDFFISTSYGPGRYDPVYEEGGHDYPLPYVRWTENRNIEAYLELLARGDVTLKNLLDDPHPVDSAPEAYAAMTSGEGSPPPIALLAFPEREEATRRTVEVSPPIPVTGPSQIALVGAGAFAQGMHLPHINKLKESFKLRRVVSRTGTTARAVAQRYEAPYASTDVDEAIADPEVDLVMITTRHDLHADQTLKALQAGKHVFVEKPLALTPEELAPISAFYKDHAGTPPLLMTGYNRRFSPALTKAKKLLEERPGPMMVTYRMNAGHLPPDHWTHGPEGGGRNIGEACHIYDLFNFLTDASHVKVEAAAIDPGDGPWHKNDNFTATVTYEDGSVCALTYTALGGKEHPKERMEIFQAGRVIEMDDYKSLKVTGGGQVWKAAMAQKGQFEELQSLGRTLKEGGAWPISLEEQVRATEISFAVEELIRA